MWNNDDQTGQVAARMETTLGSASISISQQQAPKKCAPVVAPKPKFNPYKHAGEPTHSDPAADYPPPPPPAEESTGFSPPSGSFPPPPVMNSCDYQPSSRVRLQMLPGATGTQGPSNILSCESSMQGGWKADTYWWSS